MLKKLILVIPFFFLVFVSFSVDKAYANYLEGTVFIDSNGDGVWQKAGGVEVGYPAGTRVTAVGRNTGASYSWTTNAIGLYGDQINSLPVDTYTVTATVPPGYIPTTSNPATFLLDASLTFFDFGIRPVYTISGEIFNDVNRNRIKDVGEVNYTGAAQITSSGGTVSFNSSNNTYIITGLLAGTYTVTASFIPSLLSGYQLVEPKPASFSVRVGPSCNVSNSLTGGYCSGGSIQNLNFAVTNSWSWIQTLGLSMRFDDGFINNVPSGTTCGGGAYSSGTDSTFTTPGIIFTGDTTPDFGQGSASNKNWVVGGITYPEVFSGSTSLSTSAQNLVTAAKNAGIQVQDLSSVASCRNPASQCNLQGLRSGFYHTTGDINFNHSADFNGGNYVIVADGTINIVGNNVGISVGIGSTLILSAGKDILIDPSIHAAADVCPVPAGQLQGVFSADRNIIVEGNGGNCALGADIMLNIDGSVIPNAGGQGGSFDNQRDLCGNNKSYPAVTFRARPDFILNAPVFLTGQSTTVSHEENP